MGVKPIHVKALFAVVFHGLQVAVVVALVYGIADNAGWHENTVHPMLMCLGMIGFISEGMVVRHWLPLRPDHVRLLHGVIQVVGALCMLAGFAVMFNYKQKNNIKSFQSAHAQMGLFILCATVAQLFFGIAKLGIILFKNQKLLRFHGKWGSSLLVLLYAQLMLQVSAFTGTWLTETERDIIFVCGSLLAVLTLFAEHINKIVSDPDEEDGEVYYERKQIDYTDTTSYQ